MTEQPTPPSDENQNWTTPPQPPGNVPYGYVVYQPPPLNTNAILALVLGAMVLPPLGIWLGYKAQEEIARTGERGIELAKAGVVVGWVLTGLFVLAFCGICVLGSVWPNQ